MKTFAFKIYWIMTIIGQILYVSYLISYGGNNDIGLLQFIHLALPIVLIITSWVLIIPITNTLTDNDNINEAFKKSNAEFVKAQKIIDVVKELALEKFGITNDEIIKRIKEK